MSLSSKDNVTALSAKRLVPKTTKVVYLMTVAKQKRASHPTVLSDYKVRTTV